MIYVTADIHGCSLEKIQNLLTQVEFSDEDYLFVLGDVIDRGEHGAELLLWLTEQPNVQLILGNHEGLLLACSFLFEEVNDESLAKLDMQKMALLENWMQNGGHPTIKGLQKIMKKSPDLIDGILEYLWDAPLYEVVEVGNRNYILVHSGLSNFSEDKQIPDYSSEELLMNRPQITDRYFEGNTTVIFGHTPTYHFGEEYRGKVVKTDTWWCIDVGVAEGNSPILMCLDNGQVYS